MDNQLTRQAGDEIKALLNSLEAQLNGAFLTASRLAVAAGDFGVSHDISMRAGQPITEQLGRTIALITEARGQAIAAHRSAERLQDWVGYGDGEKKPDDHPFTTARQVAPLEIVGRRAA